PGSNEFRLAHSWQTLDRLISINKSLWHAPRPTIGQTYANKMRMPSQQHLATVDTPNLITAPQVQTAIVAADPGGDLYLVAGERGRQVVQFMTAHHASRIQLLIG